MPDIKEWLIKQPRDVQALAEEFPLGMEFDVDGPVYVVGWNPPAILVSRTSLKDNYAEASQNFISVLARRLRKKKFSQIALDFTRELFANTSGGGQATPFVNAFDHPQVGSLRYNTCQQGNPIPIVYGTQRCTINVIEGFNFSSKSKGTKGGKGLGSVGGKKGSNANYSVFVAFALCQGPISLTDSPEGFLNGSVLENRAWSNGSVIGVDSIFGINALEGDDGQIPDSTWTGADPNSPVLGYSGTFVAFGEPLQLGTTPALPDFSVEVSGFMRGTVGGVPGDGSEFSGDANPEWIIIDLLTNDRYGAGFPARLLDYNNTFLSYGQYCQATSLGMSLILDRQQPAARWIEEILQLTVADAVWTDGLLKIIPHYDSTITGNGATFTPILTWQFSFDDLSYIAKSGEDPVVITRSDPSLVTNWMSIEYMDSGNNYNPTVLPVFDQGLIDQFGIRTEPVVQGHQFTHSLCAFTSLQLQLQRKTYVRNKYKWKAGWKASLLEPMDIVVLSDTTLGLSAAAVRIIEIQEDDNGELTFTGEDIPGITP